MEKLSWIFSRERNISPFLCRGIGEGVWRKIPIPLLVVEKSSDGKINLRYYGTILANWKNPPQYGRRGKMSPPSEGSLKTESRT